MAQRSAAAGELEGFCLAEERGLQHAKSFFVVFVDCTEPPTADALVTALQEQFTSLAQYSIGHAGPEQQQRQQRPGPQTYYAYLSMDKQISFGPARWSKVVDAGCRVYVRNMAKKKPGPATVVEVTTHTVRAQPQWVTTSNMPAVLFSSVLLRSPDWARLARDYPDFTKEAVKRISGIPVDGVKRAYRRGGAARGDEEEVKEEEEAEEEEEEVVEGFAMVVSKTPIQTPTRSWTRRIAVAEDQETVAPSPSSSSAPSARTLRPAVEPAAKNTRSATKRQRRSQPTAVADEVADEVAPTKKRRTARSKGNDESDVPSADDTSSSMDDQNVLVNADNEEEKAAPQLTPPASSPPLPPSPIARPSSRVINNIMDLFTSFTGISTSASATPVPSPAVAPAPAVDPQRHEQSNDPLDDIPSDKNILAAVSEAEVQTVQASVDKTLANGVRVHAQVMPSASLPEVADILKNGGFEPTLVRPQMHIDLGLDTYMGFIIDHLDNTPLEVMYEDKDVPELMTAREIAVKLSNPKRKKWMNAYSIHVADDSPLANLVAIPKQIEELDITRFAPGHHSARRTFIVSSARAVTDCHQDLSGSASYIHVLTGQKIFRIVRPTAANMRLFEVFNNPNVDDKGVSFVDLECLDPHDVFEVHIRAGDTFLLPGGWIHEVSSPNKTIAVNGRALQLADLPVALRIHRQDERMGTKPEHMFPGFVELMWATATSIQKGEQQLPSNFDESRKLLQSFLAHELRKESPDPKDRSQEKLSILSKL